MNKKGFLDTEIITSVGFVVLVAMSVGATVLGYVMGKQMDFAPMAMWQLISIIVVEIIACYLIVLKMS
jgi:hypothetical protein